MENIKSQILSLFKDSIDIEQLVLATALEETSIIEFKKSLHTLSDTIGKAYLPSIAGFANNLGGTLVFGIDPVTKELVGIKDKYENLDNRYVSTTIRNGLDGNIQYLFYTQRYLGKLIGFLSIKQADSKPVIVKVDSGPVIRGEIYFRYPAQTTRIEAADLRAILNAEIQNRLSLTMAAFNKVAQIGGEKLALINTETGELDTGSQNNKYVLDEEILSKIKLIKRGSFVEEEGAPAYVIKGEIEVERVGQEYIEKHIPTLVKESELYEAFFASTCAHPKLMLEQLVHHNTQYNPLFFFVNQAGLSIDKAKLLVNSIENKEIIAATKARILERLDSSEYYEQGAILDTVKHAFSEGESAEELIERVKFTLNQSSKASEQQIARTICYNTLMKGEPLPKDIFQNHLKRAVEAMSNLEPSFIVDNKELVLGELSRFYKCERTASQTSVLRKVVCNADKALYNN